MAPSVTAAPSVIAAPSVAAASRYVSVLMCSGPASGMVFAVLEHDLVHRCKKLNIGAHVLVKQHDGSRKLKGVVVNMNPLINATVPPPARACAVPVAKPRRQRPSKRQREPEQPSQADDVATQAAKRFKCGPSKPTTLPGVSSFQPARLQRGPNDAVVINFIPSYNHVHPEPAVRHIFAAGPRPSTRYPGRHRVRRELIYNKTSMMLKSYSAPVSVEELDGIVPLDFLDNIVTLEELSAFVTQAIDDIAAPVAPVSPLHSTPVTVLPDTQSVTPSFSSEFQPLRPAPFSRRLIAADSQVNREHRTYRIERRSARHHDDGLLRCGLPDLLLSPSRLG